jgi:hypothetical protein
LMPDRSQIFSSVVRGLIKTKVVDEEMERVALNLETMPKDRSVKPKVVSHPGFCHSSPST